MATTFWWRELNGSSGSNTETTLTNINFGNSNSANLTPASYPIAAGNNSYTKYVIGIWSGDFTQINNVKFWKASGSLVTGETIQMTGSIEFATPSATDAGDPAVVTAQPAVANVNIPWWQYEGATAWFAAGPGGVINGPGSGSTMPMRLQMLTTASSPAGPVNTKTFAITYDQQ